MDWVNVSLVFAFLVIGYMYGRKDGRRVGRQDYFRGYRDAISDAQPFMIVDASGAKEIIERTMKERRER